MRGFPILPALAAAALATGCGDGPAWYRSGTGEPAANASHAAPAARTKSPPPATGKTIPAALLGVYDASLDSCAKPSDSRLAVSPTELRFHESIGTVRRVTVNGPGTVTVEADYQGEGESWRGRRELSLSNGGATLTIGGDRTTMVRVRCPAAEG